MKKVKDGIYCILFFIIILYVVLISVRSIVRVYLTPPKKITSIYACYFFWRGGRARRGASRNSNGKGNEREKQEMRWRQSCPKFGERSELLPKAKPYLTHSVIKATSIYACYFFWRGGRARSGQVVAVIKREMK